MFEHCELARLVEEIDRYLAAVDLFRALGCEPVWRPEAWSPRRPTETSAPPEVARIAH